MKAGAAVGTKRGVARCNRQIDPGMLVPQLRICCWAVQRQAISADLARLLRLCGSRLGLVGVAHYWLIRQKCASHRALDRGRARSRNNLPVIVR